VDNKLITDPSMLLKMMSVHMNMGFIITDKDDIIVYADQFIQSIAHSQGFQILKQNFLNLPKPPFKYLSFVFRSGKADMRPQHFNGIPLENIHGGNQYFAGLMLPLNDRGIYSGMICALKDITEQIVLEQRLVILQEELEKAVERRTANLAKCVRELEIKALARKGNEQLLMDMNQRYKNLFENVGVGICRLTPDGMFIEANSHMAFLLGIDNPDELKNMNSSIRDKFFVDKKQWDYLAQKLLNEKTIHRHEVQLSSKDGLIWTEFSALLVTTKWSQNCFEVIVSDISDRKQKEYELYKKATEDNLTQIPNRALCLDRLEQIIKKARRTGESFTLFFLDLDGFKETNDIYGHQAGDEILVRTTRRILGQIRDSDTLARFGGDEFCLILNSLQNPYDAEKLAKNIIKKINQPFHLKGFRIKVGISIGIFIYDQSDLTPLVLIQKADHALYKAKYLGGNTYVFYDADNR
jgi:diguanylate cyclase (GGDEF)-like protein/PAS domain S-box-containing protein